MPTLEADVLELMLQTGEPMTVAQVQAALPGQRRAHTTVSTLLSRLSDRGLVSRRERGRIYEWFPAGSAQDLAVSALERVLDGVDDQDAAILGFLEAVERRSGRKRRPRKQ